MGRATDRPLQTRVSHLPAPRQLCLAYVRDRHLLPFGCYDAAKVTAKPRFQIFARRRRRGNIVTVVEFTIPDPHFRVRHSCLALGRSKLVSPVRVRPAGALWQSLNQNLELFASCAVDPDSELESHVRCPSNVVAIQLRNAAAGRPLQTRVSRPRSSLGEHPRSRPAGDRAANPGRTLPRASCRSPESG